MDAPNIFTSSSHSLWRVKPLIFWNIICGFLFISFFTSFISRFWNYSDIIIFNLFNHPLKHSSYLRIFWSLANHHLADWFEDLCILGFYTVAIWKTKKEHRLQRCAQLIFCMFLIFFTILLINRGICRDLCKLRRTSPSLILYDAVHVSDFLTWIQVKVDSSKSFPGDHATTALMFAFSYAYLIRGKLAMIAIFYGIFLCLPRLVVGAHWPSDILIGSGCIVMFSLSWAFFTPFATKMTKQIYKLLYAFSKKSL